MPPELPPVEDEELDLQLPAPDEGLTERQAVV